ncbi:MAG: NAD(P)/FAD-dependent oxidoreductase [Porticoccaceae bacterium]|jgi:predicted Rossmann fold flavoprotein|nr:NAD(P)/FAD-dependent oxidoreductase [Porticoccaceae bacterium]MBT4213496.1 NAD(P)/FAD-dependent oxidoreductase [Porticoccaceae bacterium]MBT5071254.1 NAD(P)/FAD-dependent oxidoreductase [Porticoccaceae bacterium]MBT7564563.1 NAD(P)/FAD-dependent oxidoreductase [Porticoccaceae bacterium]MBT7947204.1 NAD(P)/FAD-dependent oxidoreductase [Porticoccaceae bacterium]
MNNYDVIVIGGGAAGLFCALTAGQRGRSVLVLDSSNKVGKKILMSGGGGCNFTNLDITPENYLSNNPHFCISALNRYNQWQFIDLVEHHQIPYHEKSHGELFCDKSSKDILKMLLDECAAAQVVIRTKAIVSQIEPIEEGGFNLSVAGQKICCQSLVVASGGLSIPTLGASGFGYDIAEQFGLNVLQRSAGLVPFTFSDWVKDISETNSGLSLDVEMSVNGMSFRENLLFTHRGISGPAALQLSSYWKPGQFISINLLPDHDAQILLLGYKQSHPKSLLRNLIGPLLSKGFTQSLQTRYWPQYAETPAAEIPNTVLVSLAGHLSNWQLKPSGTEGYRTAEVTLCGVDTDHISSKTMECKSQSGLYFVGEVLDVTGHLGGYNFQWAWASGYAAGCYV